MQDTTDTPSTEELAKELAATEGGDGNDNAGATETETAPDPETTPDAPADKSPEEPPPGPDETKTPPDDSGPGPEEKDEAPDRTIAPPSQAQADKKEADTKRRKDVIAKAERPAEIFDEEEEDRKNAIREEMELVTTDRDDFLAEAQGCQDRLTELSGLLYPHQVKSDSLVDAVRGHIKAQKRIRANRASNPERIKEILKLAGKAPVDAAFHRARARGMGRPTRKPMTSAKPAGDKAPGAAPSANGPE